MTKDNTNPKNKRELSTLASSYYYNTLDVSHTYQQNWEQHNLSI